MVTAKALESMEKESIVGCLNQSQVCSHFEDPAQDGEWGKAFLFSAAIQKPSLSDSLSQHVKFGCSYAKISSAPNSYSDSREKDKSNV